MIDANFEQNITDLLIKYRGIQSSIDATRQSIENLDVTLKELECEKYTLRNCKPIIDDIINKFSDSLLRKLESLLTIALKKIFYDRDYSIQIKTLDKRNSKCVELYLNDSGNLIPIKNSCVAGGILVVIATVIQCFYIINLPNVANALFLDEQLGQVSAQYIDNFIEFIKTLCSETGLSIVLITHDNKFMKYGDRVYIADKGKFTLQELDYIAADN
jgi:DNA repair exonuclease SbcCD ATPase subunit